MKSCQILMPALLSPGVIAALEDRFTLHRLWEQVDPDRFLQDHGAAIRGMAASSRAGQIGGELYDRLPALEIVANFGVGYDTVDVDAAAARGIIVTNTPGVLDEEVADLTLGLLLATVRRIPQADRHVREGRWPAGSFPLSPTLRGRTIGILGLGSIGKAIARRLDGFGVKIAYHGRSRQALVGYDYHPTPEALAEACDVLVAIVPGGTETRHLVDAAVLAALGPQGILINVARGSVVDQAALVAALQSGTILAAGLDVFEDEPHVPQTLLDLPGVVVLPHVGSASTHTRAAMGQLVVDNLVAWFDTGRPVTPVNAPPVRTR
ncbi:dehydrogenase [Croceibacterium mercuriale]|uniref:Dehydrogenase n=1 Tax=Croceibacterium mercuriale TaxID=1572751 RepID=A0A0B2BUL5_9SPHN|nr:2-hydroxyacid dehydrogenase [Croceibacterium mercuriale]KHL25248.1 dehydrogenase [Croceibacterium mercuriale]